MFLDFNFIYLNRPDPLQAWQNPYLLLQMVHKKDSSFYTRFVKLQWHHEKPVQHKQQKLNSQ